MEAYDPAAVFSSIDHHGRYAYGNQANIAQWNLARLAETLLDLIDTDSDKAIARATEVLMAFPERVAVHWLAVMRGKLGLDDHGDVAADRQLAEDFLVLLQAGKRDFTNAFRALYAAASGHPEALHDLFGSDAAFGEWQARWLARQPSRDASLLAAMQRANPWAIARNHRVEEALEAAVERMDMAPFERLLAVLQNPFVARADDIAYTEPAPAEVTACYQTFCGT
jgi:uncharacterized protein YdiU (UPF0061 family)